MTPVKVTVDWSWPAAWPRLWGTVTSVEARTARTLTPPAPRTLEVKDG